jgi:hypothetical protein
MRNSGPYDGISTENTQAKPGKKEKRMPPSQNRREPGSISAGHFAEFIYRSTQPQDI